MKLEAQPAGPTFRWRLWLPCLALALGIVAGCGRPATSPSPTSSRPNSYYETTTPTRTPRITLDPTAPPTLAPTRRPTPTVAPATPNPESEMHFLGQRVTVGLNPSVSMECYTFYPDDGIVELRHNGSANVSDSGTYRRDSNNSWRVSWFLGGSATVVGAGEDALNINGLRVTRIRSCIN